MAKTYREANLCLAGGVALNCVANGKIVKEGLFERVWVQPAAGDSGGALARPHRNRITARTGGRATGWHAGQLSRTSVLDD